MERLTKRTMENANVKQIVICNHKEEDCNDSCMYGKCKWNEKALKKLKEYEDAEEQGLMLRLPCKLGKNLYDITEFAEGYDSPDIYIIDTSRIEISKDKEGLIYTIDSVDYREKDFGTVLFKTEEAALKAISEKGWLL